MERNKQREIASKGGKAAHQKGTAHEWTSEEAREAGRKGGMASHRRKQQMDNPGSEMPSESNRAEVAREPRGDADDMIEQDSDEGSTDEGETRPVGGPFGRGNFGD